MGLIYREPAEQLGDTTPGALDTLPPVEHPAIVQARRDLALPWRTWQVLVAVVITLTLAASALWPWGFALPAVH